MRSSRVLSLASMMLLGALQQPGMAQGSPASAGEDLHDAQLAWGSDPAKRCPELRQSTAEEGAVTVVKLLVGPTGVPSHASIRSSSGSAGFDQAAMSCVLKLHFLPATRLGDGAAVESWRQFAFKSSGTVAVAAAAPIVARCDAADAGQGNPAQKSAPVTQAGDGNASHDQPGPARSGAGVCVCVDAAGKISQAPVLTSSSGLPGFDKAALELSSAAHYRPAVSSNGQPAAGCFRFKVGIEMK